MIFKILYKKVLKPVLFLFKADDVHSLFLKVGNFLGRFDFMKKITKNLFYFEDKSLNQKVLDIDFKNPVGLAAGFDYDADLINILPSVGFGFNTIGTVTALPYKGNPAPMLDRLPKSKSLLVNKGFKSNGIVKVLKKISNTKKGIPLGISIGSTNRAYKDLEEMVDDIIFSFNLAIEKDFFDYYELNISCPNLINIENLKDKLDSSLGFTLLLNKLSFLKINKPLFVKMHLEKSVDETLHLVETASMYRFVSGFIFANLVKDRTNKYFDEEEIKNAGKGNFSGKPTEELSNILIGEVYKKYKDRFVIIGCGGIFNGRDAYEKIKNGASLVQMITGMVYEGPSQIGIINKEISELLEQDKISNIKEAIGFYYK